MNIFSKHGRETPDDVRREFNGRIERLMNEIEPREESFFQRERTLKDLARWSQNALEVRARLNAQVQKLGDALRDARGDLGQLQRSLEQTAKDLSKEQSLRLRFESELQATEERMTNILDETNRSHATELHEKEDAYRTLQQRFESESREKDLNHAVDLDNQAAAHQHEVSQLNARIVKLTEDIMVNQADSRAWTDEKLKMQFLKLRRAVESITSPHSLVIHERSPSVRARLDPHGFLARENEENYHFLLRGEIWKVLMEQFFAAPLGFGALGQGAGYQALLRIYTSWRSLFDETANTDYHTVFTQEAEANKWRSSTFESIMAAILAAGRSGSSTNAHTLFDLYDANVGEAKNRISSLLLDVTGAPPSNQATKNIAELVKLTSELGLQFGVQPTHLNLYQPARGQLVEIGREVFDCQDGDSARGEKVKIDLLVSPGLYRLGDGKGNMLAKIPLEPCEIYPVMNY